MTHHILAEMEAIANRIQPTSREDVHPDPDTIKMFVGQIPRHWTENELTKLFEEFGPVYQISILKDKTTQLSRGCCFVIFYTRKAAIEAQSTLHNVKILPGMHHPIQIKPADSENRNERKLFIGMLSKKCCENDVRLMFASFGNIEECTVLREASGQSKGCAFVTYSSRQCAINAIKTMNHSQTMEGCNNPLVVKFADTQKDKDQKRHYQIMANLMNMANLANLNSQYLTLNEVNQIFIYCVSSSSIYITVFYATSQPNFGIFSSLPHVSSGLTSLGLQQIAALAQASANSSNAGLNSRNLQSLTGQTLSTNIGLPSTSNSISEINSASLQSIAALAGFATSSGLNPVVMQNLATAGNSSGLNLSSTGSKSTKSSLNGISPLSPVTALGMSNSSLGSVSAVNSIRSVGNGAPLDALAQAYSSIQPYSALQFAQIGLQSQSPAGKQIEGPEGANLFIYHLPQEFNDVDLAQTFMPFGNVISAKVFIDKQTNLSKCFGFVSYDNPSSAHTAIQAMNGFQIGMKRLKVQLKRSKDANKPY